MRVLQLLPVGAFVFGLVWHPLDAKAAHVQAGQALYQQYCSTCHGPQGKGNGPAAVALRPKPRDHTDGNYMNKLRDAHLVHVISTGARRSCLLGRGRLAPNRFAT